MRHYNRRLSRRLRRRHKRHLTFIEAVRRYAEMPVLV